MTPNKELYDQISSSIDMIHLHEMIIACILRSVFLDKKFVANGYSSIVDYAKDKYNMSKAQVIKFYDVAFRFDIEFNVLSWDIKFHNRYDNRLDKYSIDQLAEFILAKTSDDDIIQMIDEGIVDRYLTPLQIRQRICAFNSNKELNI